MGPEIKFVSHLVSSDSNSRLPRTLSEGIPLFWQSLLKLSLFYAEVCGVGGVNKLCDITADMTRFAVSDFERHKYRPGLFKPSQLYYLVRYNVKVLIGPDLRFEIWFKGQRCSGDDTIEVAWETASAAAEPHPAALV